VSVLAHSGQWAVSVAWGPGDDPIGESSFEAVRLEHSPWVAPTAASLPPADDRDFDLLSRGASDELRAICERVAALGTMALEGRDLIVYGRLLFGAALAPAWDDIVNAADGELIEVALSVPSDGSLQSVPWELLHDGASFLVTHSDMDVAVTRRIESPAATPAIITPPARVLFAIGAELTDPDVQAGAEFLGLMRELERTGSRIASYLVERASPARVAEAVERFEPDSVHFIAHGQVSSKGVPALLMRPDDDKPGALPVPVSAETLHSCVTAGEKHPAMVVLAACESGAVSAATGVPIAEELVRRGIPVAVAMAGTVADQACRLFTQRMGTALASGGQLLRAAAQGRLAASRRGARQSTTIDWALPSLFLGNEVRSDYQPVKAESARVTERIEKFGFAEGPVFCGRSAFFGLYDRLLAPGGMNVLAIYSEGDQRGLGKTRILREYGTRALLEGHVPCVVGLDGQASASDPRRFAEALLRAIYRARSMFDLPPQARPAILKSLAPTGQAVPDIDGSRTVWKNTVNDLLGQWRDEDKHLDLESLRVRIASDLAALIDEARQKDDLPVNANSRALVLLDTVEEWGDTIDLLAPTPKKPGLLSQYGLGDEDEEVPVVLAFRTGAGIQDDLLKGLVEFASGRRWIEAEKVQEFAEGDEEGLAYRWIMLNANPMIAPPVSAKTYTVVRPDGQWMGWLRYATGRIPKMLSDPHFYGAVQILEEQGDLAASDDNEALAFLLGSQP
jgi:CHAT domain